MGDCLRHATVHPTGPASAGRVEALVRVLSVFHHAGETRVVGAERLRARGQYLYEIFDSSDAEAGAIWPDGQPRPVRPSEEEESSAYGPLSPEPGRKPRSRRRKRAS